MEKIDLQVGYINREAITSFLHSYHGDIDIIEESDEAVNFSYLSSGLNYTHYYRSTTLQNFVDYYNETFIGQIRINSKNELEPVK